MIARSIFVPILLLCSMFLVSSSVADDSLNSKFREIPGRPYALDFELMDQVGHVWQLSESRGYVVVVNFWATWCAPCLKELPSMHVLWSRLEDQGFKLLAINVGEELLEIKRFLETFDPPLDFPILIDPNMQVANAWGVRGVPTTYVVDQRGRLVEFAEGEVDFTDAEVIATLRRLIDDNK